MKHAQHQEHGFSLIIAVNIVALLTVLGMMVLNAVEVDTDLAAADRASHNALYIAEAGLAWGLKTLREPPYNFDSESPNFVLVEGQPLISKTDKDDCSDAVWCVVADGWHTMHADTQMMNYGNGTFRVAAAYEPDPGNPDAPQNTTVRLRAMGKTPDGARRMLEVVLSTGSSE